MDLFDLFFLCGMMVMVVVGGVVVVLVVVFVDGEFWLVWLVLVFGGGVVGEFVY